MWLRGCVVVVVEEGFLMGNVGMRGCLWCGKGGVCG